MEISFGKGIALSKTLRWNAMQHPTNELLRRLFSNPFFDLFSSKKEGAMVFRCSSTIRQSHTAKSHSRSASVMTLILFKCQTSSWSAKKMISFLQPVSACSKFFAGLLNFLLRRSLMRLSWLACIISIVSSKELSSEIINSSSAFNWFRIESICSLRKRPPLCVAMQMDSFIEEILL